MSRTRTSAILLCLAGVGLFGPAAFAQNTHFKVYGGFGYVAPMSDSHVTFNSIEDSLKTEKKVGWNAGFEIRPAELVGFEIDYLRATQDVKFGSRVIGETNFSPLTATLNFHLIRTTAVDVYVGPSYSYVNWGEIKLNGTGTDEIGGSEIRTNSAHGWGASAGIDIGLAPHFAVTAGLRYLNVDLKLDGNGSSSVNPLVARLGVALRF
jgi:opacity protein-like surface antigen